MWGKSAFLSLVTSVVLSSSVTFAREWDPNPGTLPLAISIMMESRSHSVSQPTEDPNVLVEKEFVSNETSMQIYFRSYSRTRKDTSKPVRVQPYLVFADKKESMELDLPFCNESYLFDYLNRTPGDHPLVMVDAGDGTWAIAQNEGLWVALDPGGSRMFQRVNLLDLEIEAGFEPNRTIAKNQTLDIPLSRIASEISVVPVTFGSLGESPAAQRYYLGTEGKAALPVVVLGYETHTSETVRSYRSLQAIPVPESLAVVVPRDLIRRGELTNLPVYRVPAKALRTTHAAKAEELREATPFTEGETRRWLGNFSEQMIELSASNLETNEMINSRANYLRSLMEQSTPLLDASPDFAHSCGALVVASGSQMYNR